MFGISDATVEEIKGRTDLADLIASYGIAVRRAGASYKACCPFHHEKTPSFNIQPDRGFYHCFGCGESGDAISFVMKQEGLTFSEAVKKLGERCGVTVLEKADPEAGVRKRLLKLHAELTAFYRRCLLEAKEGAPARDYLAARELDTPEAERFQIGYAPRSSAAMLTWAKKYGFESEELTKAGILLPPKFAGGSWYNRFAGRLVFPIRDKSGQTVAFSCRTLETDKAKMRGGKYVNSPETPLFKKSDILYALDLAAPHIVRAPRREAIVCEGQIDVIRCHLAGFRTAVASQGTSFTSSHVQILKRCADAAILVFDADAAGQKSDIRTGGEFLAAGIPVRVATLPPGEDPDSLLRTQGAEAFQRCLDEAESVTAFQVRVLRAQEEHPDSIDAVTRVSRAVLETIALCPSSVMRASLTAEAAQRLGLPVAALEEDAVKIRARAQTKAPPKKREAPAAPVEPEVAEDAAAPVNNPPPPREMAFCSFLFAHEHDAELAKTVDARTCPELFAHDFTRTFVRTWREEVTAGTDRIAPLRETMDAESRRWLDAVLADADRGELSVLTPDDEIRALLRPLWQAAIRRRQGMLDAASSPENDRRRLNLSLLARMFQCAPWEKAAPRMTAATLTGETP